MKLTELIGAKVTDATLTIVADEPELELKFDNGRVLQVFSNGGWEDGGGGAEFQLNGTVIEVEE